MDLGYIANGGAVGSFIMEWKRIDLSGYLPWSPDYWPFNRRLQRVSKRQIPMYKFDCKWKGSTANFCYPPPTYYFIQLPLATVFSTLQHWQTSLTMKLKKARFTRLPLYTKYYLVLIASGFVFSELEVILYELGAAIAPLCKNGAIRNYLNLPPMSAKLPTLAEGIFLFSTGHFKGAILPENCRWCFNYPHYQGS